MAKQQDGAHGGVERKKAPGPEQGNELYNDDNNTEARAQEEGPMSLLNQLLPTCLKCNKGVLIPLSDYGQEGSSVFFKAWACTNPSCGFSLRVDKGEVTYGKRIEPKH